ncbi:MAG: hypothetical protein K9L17_03490 [Clostridiales bacterium]|nr:hypothetical protein [Clostridiales bacterium]MCF8021743.1 hypothetical protein [Clostridiales bacterium]
MKNLYLSFKGKPLEKFFIIKNIEGLSNTSDNTKDLKFQVQPEIEIQGLVGRCYNAKAVLYEGDAKYSEEDFNLTSFQKNKTSDTRFILCCPIFNEKNEVLSIISFDSPHKIIIPQDKEEILTNIIVGFCQNLYENAPDLFK